MASGEGLTAQGQIWVRHTASEVRAMLADGRRTSRTEVGPRVRDILAALRSGAVSLGVAEAVLRADPAADLRRSVAPGREAALEVAPREVADAPQRVDRTLAAALRTSRDRLAAFLSPGYPRAYATEDGAGNRYALEVRPLGRVGIYAPGGRAVYPSSVVMAAVPARVAGVSEVVLATPAGPDGRGDPAVLAAAAIAGVDRVFLLGPVPAVAAMAWGLGPVPAVDKIVGPGGPYLVEAKRQVFGDVGIDGLAGPTELVVIASGDGPPAWIASDLLAQAEHGPDSLCLLLTPDCELCAAVGRAVVAQLAQLPERRAADAAASLRQWGGAVLCRDLEDALALAEEIAPEHLSLQGAAAEGLVGAVSRAGAVFVGPWSPVAGGDYSAGSDHILPTGGSARFASGLGVADFVRRMAVFTGSGPGTRAWAGAASTLARAEGFAAHAASVDLRASDAPPLEAGDPIQVPYVPPVPSGAVRMDLNENPYPWAPDRWERVLRELRVSEPTRYPRRTADLEAALAAYAGVPPSWCLAANGSDELILAAVTAWGQRCARMLVPTPTFGMYRRTAEAAGLPVTAVPLGPAPGFGLPVDRILRELRRGGNTLLLLCRPNNPTGTLWPLEEIQTLIRQPGVYAVVDEAYIEFSAHGGGGADTLLPWLAENPRLCLLRTLSKAFGMAGLRVGYALGSPLALDSWRRVVQPWAVSAFSAAAAMVALERGPEVEAQVAVLVAERERLAIALGGVPGIRVCPSHANYILFGVDPEGTGWTAEDLFAQLYADGIVLRRWPGDPTLERCVRVSVGQPEENDRFLAALRAALGQRGTR